MRESRLRRGLPRDVATEVFDPAYRELLIEHLEGGRTGVARVRHRLRIVLLFLDCWRLVLTGLPSRLLDPRAPKTSLKRRRTFMSVLSMRQAFRRLLKEPGFTVAAVLTLALGVGANVAVFAVVEAVLLRPLPYVDADALMIVNHRDERTGITKEFIATGDYVDLTQQQSAFEDLVAYGSFQTVLYGGDEPVHLGGLGAAPGLLEVLGARPVHGRTFEPADGRPGAAPVAMLGWDLWQERFGGDPAVVGRSERIGQQVRTIVGIAPRGFRFPPTADADVIFPMTVPLTAPAERRSGYLFAVARVKEGQTAESASADLAAVSRRMEAEHPDQNQGSMYFAVPLRDQLVGSTREALMLLLAAVGFVLLIACANVANLQLARTLARRRETAVRLALGAGRRQLAGMFLSETVVLALLAGVAGIVFAAWGVRGLVALVPESVRVPGLSDVRLNGPVLAFATGIAIIASIAFGAVAAATVRLQNAGDVLVTAGRATMSRMMRRATSGLVVVEVALAVVLLIGAGLILRSFAGLLAVDPGFRYDNVLTTQIQLPADRYADVEARRAFYGAAFDRLRALPGVEDVGAGVVVPLTGNNWTVPFERDDRPVAPGERPPDVGWQSASGGFFTTLDIPLVAGRVFDGRDGPGAPPVVLVSQALAERFYPGEEAVGRRIRLGDATAEIVGVVGDIRRAGLTDEPRADMYFPFEAGLSPQITLFVRTPDPAGQASAVRAVLREVEPNTAILGIRSLADVAGESVRVTKLALWVLGVFALLALALAAVGIYGVMAYVVKQRTREIGTRMAMGATRWDITWMVLRQGGQVAGLGLGAGLVAGLGAARALRSVLYGVSAADPAALAGAAVTLGLIALVACWIPARRASGLDPARTLGQP